MTFYILNELTARNETITTNLQRMKFDVINYEFVHGFVK